MCVFFSHRGESLVNGFIWNLQRSVEADWSHVHQTEGQLEDILYSAMASKKIYEHVYMYIYTLHVLDHFLNVGCATTIFYRQRPFHTRDSSASGLLKVGSDTNTPSIYISINRSKYLQACQQFWCRFKGQPQKNGHWPGCHIQRW